MEVGRIAVECAAHQGLHVKADQVVLECLKDGEPATPGTSGEVVVTGLSSSVMPFIRYRLGDRCQLSHKPCTCGCSFPLISAPEGRHWPMIRLPSCGLAAPGVVMAALRRFPWLDEFLIIQESEDQFLVLLVLAQQPDRDALTELGSRVIQALGEPVNVRVEVVDSIERTGQEAVTFVSRLPAPDVGIGAKAALC